MCSELLIDRIEHHLLTHIPHMLILMMAQSEEQRILSGHPLEQLRFCCILLDDRHD